MDNLPKQLKFQDKEIFSRKIDFLLGFGKEKLHLILDFDRTLTGGKNRFGEDITTWQVLRDHLPANEREICQKLYKKYRALETSNRLTISDAVTWWSSILDIYADNKLKWAEIEKEAAGEMIPREGARKLFEICERNNIPVVIISAGIRNLIDFWCRVYDIKPERVISNNLIIDGNGFACGWNKDHLVHVLNKKEMGRKELAAVRETRPNAILVGDSLDDADAVDSEHNALKMIIDNTRFDDAPRHADYESQVFQKFDAIIESASFLPVVEILEKF